MQNSSRFSTAFALAASCMFAATSVTALPSTTTSTTSTTTSSSSSSAGSNISKVAESCLGKQMWKGYGLPSGYLGCAAAVSNVLKKSGYTSAHSAAVVLMRNQMIASKRVKEIVIRNGPNEELLDSKLEKLAQPGDVVVAFMKPPEKNFNGGGNAHCGILSTPTEICTNDWNDGVWKKLNIHLMFDYYPYLRIIRVEK